MIIGLHAIGHDVPIGALEPGTEGLAGTARIFLASESFTALPTDAAAHRHYLGVLQDFTLRDSADQGRQIGGSVSVTRGRAILANPDGALDPSFFFGSVNGRRITVKALEKNSPPGGEALDDAFVLFDGIMEAPEVSSTQVLLPVRGGAAIADAPLRDDRFAGSGGAEGDADLKNLPKPCAFGYAYGVTPVYLGVISGKHSYLVSGGTCLPINDVPAFYDRGVALTKVASAPTSGQYSIDTATGIITIGGTVPTLPTCDVEGYVRSGTFLTKTADIWEAILEDFAGVENIYIDTLSRKQFNSDQASDVGIWVGAEEATALSVIDELLAGANAIGGTTRAGKAFILQLKAPTNAIRAIFDEQNLIEIANIPGPANMSPTSWKYIVGWKRNYTVTDDIATAATEAQRQFMRQERREATAEDADILTQHKRSQPMHVPGLFASESDAQDEADRMLALMPGKRLYRIDSGNLSPQLEIGHTVEITYPRFNLNKRLGTIVGWSMDLTTRRFNPIVFA